MADYQAVLQRTLSGFTNPQPQLRSKLYERARTTIARQLANRNPPLSQEALDAELHKLELAITNIEAGYDPTYQGPVSQAVAESTIEQPPLAEPTEVAAPLEPAPPELERFSPVVAEPDPVLDELALPEPAAVEPTP